MNDTLNLLDVHEVSQNGCVSGAALHVRAAEKAASKPKKKYAVRSGGYISHLADQNP